MPISAFHTLRLRQIAIGKVMTIINTDIIISRIPQHPWPRFDCSRSTASDDGPGNRPHKCKTIMSSTDKKAIRTDTTHVMSTQCQIFLRPSAFHQTYTHNVRSENRFAAANIDRLSPSRVCDRRFHIETEWNATTTRAVARFGLHISDLMTGRSHWRHFSTCLQRWHGDSLIQVWYGSRHHTDALTGARRSLTVLSAEFSLFSVKNVKGCGACHRETVKQTMDRQRQLRIHGVKREEAPFTCMYIAVMYALFRVQLLLIFLINYLSLLIYAVCYWYGSFKIHPVKRALNFGMVTDLVRDVYCLLIG